MVSIKEVAEIAGVSVATVSRTLSRPEKVAESTREKVMAAVERCGYVTNVMASNFRRRKSQTIVVLVPDIANLFYSSIVQEIEFVARKHGYQILLGETQQDPEIESAYSALVSQRMADGIISLGMNIPFRVDPRRKSADQKWPPLVMVGEYTGKIPLPKVGIDNVQAAADATRHLIDLGHSHIAFLGGPKDFSLCKERLKGFRREMRRAGLSAPSSHIQYGEFKLASGYSEAKSVLQCSPRPTALFCANDEIAMGAMKALREAGLRVPRDISIIGFDDLDIAGYCATPLTTILQPRRKMGGSAMELMLGLLGGDTSVNTSITLPHQLIIRESTAAPR
ncbi:LacI family DNA-binding transcriptional regulator [Haliea sp. E17]|uniref:LacI family DNA-binding transcriptional regulator n=1 Tax=Haliea sp. E17 TaxID=3401576 RepID=UPI003AACC35D